MSYERQIFAPASTVPQQRGRAFAGNRVRYAGLTGVLNLTVTDVSTDRRTFRDENGTERETGKILL